MATNRDSSVVAIRFRYPGAFMWSSEADIETIISGNSVTTTVDWEQGVPGVANFALNDISIQFFSGRGGTTSVLGTTAVGDQTLADIITVENFTDNGNGTGTVDIKADPSGITTSELTSTTNYSIKLRVSQPDPGD